MGQEHTALLNHPSVSMAMLLMGHDSERYILIWRKGIPPILSYNQLHYIRVHSSKFEGFSSIPLKSESSVPFHFCRLSSIDVPFYGASIIGSYGTVVEGLESKENGLQMEL